MAIEIPHKHGTLSGGFEIHKHPNGLKSHKHKSLPTFLGQVKRVITSPAGRKAVAATAVTGAALAIKLKRKSKHQELSYYISNQESSQRRRTRERAKAKRAKTKRAPRAKQDTMYQVPVEEEVINEHGQVISKSTVVHHTRASTRQDVIRAMVNVGESVGMTLGKVLAQEGILLWLMGGLGEYRRWKIGDKVSTIRHERTYAEHHYVKPTTIGGLAILGVFTAGKKLWEVLTQEDLGVQSNDPAASGSAIKKYQAWGSNSEEAVGTVLQHNPKAKISAVKLVTDSVGVVNSILSRAL